MSRICGELIRPSLRANLVFRLIATITVAENQSLTHDGSNLGGDQKPMEELFRTSLEEWQSARTGRTVKERRLVDELERVKQRARELEMELELQSLREQVARMTRKTGRVLALDTVRECIDVRHEWIFKNGLVVGHVLVADEGALVDALQSGDVLHASLDDVLVLPWSDNGARSPFAAQMESVFSDFVKQLSSEASAQRMRDLDARLPPPQKSSRTVF